ncbi:MAG: hypothetical protein HOK97_19035 [Deltaproteobacteria bacterium]|nr:hypothetical protein [Deltaproteobacteria bacterium]MBT6491872.1 hypothetical protein [Deltaproteobacteria bacterium]
MPYPLSIQTLLLLSSLTLAACQNKVYTLTGASIQDPESCAECHPLHYNQWSSSMHAYAGEDPVFLAMNRRGQRETNGELGAFCVSCHAPVALRLGLTQNGLNLPELPAYTKGVTCYYCHSVVEVNGTHNNPLVLAQDEVLRGGILNPVETDAHASGYSTLLDGDDIKSASMCGSCHDIVTPQGFHIERTYAEWKSTLYSDPDTQPALSCPACHQSGTNGVIATGGNYPERRIHDHYFPGVDLALTPFPHAEQQREQVERALNASLRTELCVYPDDERSYAVVTLENIGSGHSWPSGASADRRAWVELEASIDGEVFYTSGKVDHKTPITSASDTWIIRDKLYNSEGHEVHMFWEAMDYTSNALPGPTALSPLNPDYVDTHVMRTYEVPGTLDKVRLQVHIRPIGLDILDDLIESGDLDPEFRDRMQTITIESASLEWSVHNGVACIP